MDSDGSIGVHVNWYKVRAGKHQDSKQPTYQPRAAVKQLDHQAVELFGELFDGHHYVDRGKASTYGSGRPINVWQVHSRASGVVLRALRPYLRVKVRQCDLALELCELNASPRRHTFVLPEVDPDEELLPLLVAAERAGRSPATAYQSVKLKNIPFVKNAAGKLFVPASYVDTWRDRPSGATRRPEVSERMAEIATEIKSLNSGKRGQVFQTPRRYAS
jgi:hypothetical protein